MRSNLTFQVKMKPFDMFLIYIKNVKPNRHLFWIERN